MEINIESQQPTRDPRGIDRTPGKVKARLRTDFHTGMIDYDEDSCHGPEKIEFVPDSGADDNDNEKFAGLRIMVPPPPKNQSCWDPILIGFGFTQIGNVLYRSIGKNGIRIVIGPQSIYIPFFSD